MESKTWERRPLVLNKSASDGARRQWSDSSARAIGVAKSSQVRKEIIRSEESYVKGLRTLVGVFLRPMEKWAAQGVDEADITSDDIREIFANAEEILSFNEQLLRKLVDDVHDHRCIGLTFKGATDMLETYSVYVKNYHKAMKRLALCEGYPSFKAFLRACEYQDACKGLNLRAYLIQPVQRVPRYRLLLLKLLRRTPKSNPRWAQQREALGFISRVATQLDEEAHGSLQLTRALEVQAEFGQKFLTPSSRLLKEGLLYKVGSGGPRPHKFVLFSDSLVYGTETMRAKLSWSIDSSGSEGRKYKIHRRIPCNEFLILDDVESSNAFLVIYRKWKSFMVVAASAEDKKEWIRAFEECFAGISDFSRADGDTPSLNSTVSSRQVSESELEDSSYHDGQEYREISDESIAATDSTADTTGDVSSACTDQQPRPWSSSSMAAFSQSFSATMSAGLHSLGYGKNAGDLSHIEASTVIATDLNRGVMFPERITSLEALSASCVEVWMVVDGRTDKIRVSLRRLPPGSHHGVFKIRQTVISSGESNKTSPPDTAYTTDTQSDDCTSQNSLSTELGNTTQSRSKETHAEGSSRRLFGHKILAIARQGSFGLALGWRPQGEKDPEESKTPTSLGKTKHQSGAEDEILTSYKGEDSRATQETEDDAPYAHHHTRCSHVDVECVDEIYGSSHSPLEHADPDHEATCVPGTSDLTPVSSADILIGHEAGVRGHAGYDSEGGSAQTNDGEAARKTNKSLQSRFLRSSRFRGIRYKPRIAPTVPLGRSPLKQIRHSSSDSYLKSSLYARFGYRWRKYRAWATKTGDMGADLSAGEEEQSSAGGEPHRDDVLATQSGSASGLEAASESIDFLGNT